MGVNILYVIYILWVTLGIRECTIQKGNARGRPEKRSFEKRAPVKWYCDSVIGDGVIDMRVLKVGTYEFWINEKFQVNTLIIWSVENEQKVLETVFIFHKLSHAAVKFRLRHFLCLLF